MAINHTTPPGEIWKPIFDYPAYEISNYGRVRSYWKRHKRKYILGDMPNKFLKPFENTDGYLSVRLSRIVEVKDKPIAPPCA